MQRALARLLDPSFRIRGRRLQAIRGQYLRIHPLCAKCIEVGAVTLAIEVDHIVPLYLGGTDTDDNRQGLCGNCHQTKTAADMGYKPKGADLAGLPTDPRHPWNQAR